MRWAPAMPSAERRWRANAQVGVATAAFYPAIILAPAYVEASLSAVQRAEPAVVGRRIAHSRYTTRDDARQPRSRRLRF
jgi:hypothetical protein